MKTIGVILTSHKALGDTGRETGFHLAEMTHAASMFEEQGYEVEFLSVAGGEPPMDAVKRDDATNAAFLDSEQQMEKIRNTKPVAEAKAEDYAALYFPGGHGTMWDFPENKDIQELVRTVYENGGVIAAVCHGPAAFVNVKLSNGEYLVDGKSVNCFTDEEEEQVNLHEVVPFLLESKLRERGANFEKSGMFEEHVAIDERLVTGQNPMSVKAVSEALMELLED